MEEVALYELTCTLLMLCRLHEEIHRIFGIAEQVAIAAMTIAGVGVFHCHHDFHRVAVFGDAQFREEGGVLADYSTHRGDVHDNRVRGFFTVRCPTEDHHIGIEVVATTKLPQDGA